MDCEEHEMKFIFNTENLLFDVILQIHDKDESLISSVFLPSSNNLTYVEFYSNVREYILSLHSDEDFQNQSIAKARNLEDGKDIKRMVYMGISKEEIDKEKELQRKSSYKDNWKKEQEILEEDKEEKIGFLEAAADEDVLEFNYAYQTVLEDIEENVQELFFVFNSLPQSNGTIIRAIAQKSDEKADIIPYRYGQFFKRIPNLQEIERKYKNLKKANQIWFYIVIVALLLGYGLFYVFIKPSVLWWIALTVIGLILMGYFHLSTTTVEEGYQLIRDNEVITSIQLEELLNMEEEKDV